MKPTKQSIAFLIYNKDRSKILIVKRPIDDNILPGVWGLPAGSLKDNETFEKAVIRSGLEKLGVELKVKKYIGENNIERDSFISHMEEYEAEIIKGEPNVPQLIQGMTQYEEWKWGKSSDLKEAASKGSLCSQIYLNSINEDY